MAVVLVYPLRLASTAVGVVNFKGKRIIYKRDFYFLKSLVAYTHRVTNFIMCIDHICIERIGVKICVCMFVYVVYELRTYTHSWTDQSANPIVFRKGNFNIFLCQMLKMTKNLHSL